VPVLHLLFGHSGVTIDTQPAQAALAVSSEPAQDLDTIVLMAQRESGRAWLEAVASAGAASATFRRTTVRVVSAGQAAPHVFSCPAQTAEDIVESLVAEAVKMLFL